MRATPGPMPPFPSPPDGPGGELAPAMQAATQEPIGQKKRAARFLRANHEDAA